MKKHRPVESLTASELAEVEKVVTNFKAKQETELAAETATRMLIKQKYSTN